MIRQPILHYRVATQLNGGMCVMHELDDLKLRCDVLLAGVIGMWKLRTSTSQVLAGMDNPRHENPDGNSLDK